MIRWLNLSVWGVLLTAAVGMLAGAGGYTFYYAEGAAYLSNDPAACANCHIMNDQYDGWQKASHHGVATCNDCHVPHDLVGKYLGKAENGYLHSKAFTLENFHEPIRMRQRNWDVLLKNCIDCHQDLVSPIVGAAVTHGEQADCVRCHQAVGHGPAK